MTSVYQQGPVPEGAAARLREAVIAVCGGSEVSIPRWDDRSSWRLDARPEATEEEIAAARAVMAVFDPWGSADFPSVRPAFDPSFALPDEDEGQPAASEIYTEEDVEALGAVAGDHNAELEASEPDPLHRSSTDAPTEDVDHTNDGPVYPGIAILPDELGARRNAVLAAITTEKLTRLSIAMDPSRADFLAARFADYQNAGALGLPIDDALAADSRAFQELRDRRDRITNYAMQLEQSALDGDMDRLSAMHAGLGDGWP